MGLIKSGGGFFNGKGLIGAGGGHVNTGHGNVGGKGNGGGGNPPGGTISAPSAGAGLLYSLDKLSTTYAGSCFRVRRSSDNTEQDIGFSGNKFNAAGLSAFVGVNDGFITKWYDQSGNGIDLVQATTAHQPMIVDAGTVLQKIYWDGVDDELTSSTTLGGSVGTTVYLAGHNRLAQPAAANGNIEAASSYGYTNTRRTTFNTGYDTRVAHANGNENFPTASAEEGKVFCWEVDRSGGTLATQLLLYIDGVAQTATDSSGVIVTQNSSSTAAAFTFGAAPGGTVALALAARTIAVYPAAHNSTVVASNSTLLKYRAANAQLDNYTTNLWGLYSLIKQRSSYSGACLRVLRSSDSTEQDIGFDSVGYLDSTALLTFVGAGDGFVTKFYDQSGGGNDFVQAAAGTQPAIVSSGVYNSYLVFDGVNDAIQTTNNSGTPTAFTVYMRGILRNSGTLVRIYEHNPADLNHTSNCYWSTTDKTLRYYIAQTTATNLRQASYNVQPDGQVIACVFDRTKSALGDVATVQGYSGGTASTGTSVSNLGSITGSHPAAPWRIAGDPAATFGPVSLHTFAIYETAHDAATVNRISRAIG